MSLNITFDGILYDKASNYADDSFYYQAYFYKASTSSSPSAWNSVRNCESSGYYNVNLGDADWLGQGGTALPGSKVILVFWKGSSDRTRDCSVLTEWSATEIILNDSVVYSNNTQTKENIAPVVAWASNIPTHPYVSTTYYIENSSTDEHSWVFGNVTMNHWYYRYGQIINGTNSIDTTTYVWGDGSADLVVDGVTDGSHSWATSGVYTYSVIVEDNCGTTTTGTEEVSLYFRPPVPAITMYPDSPAPNEVVYFKYTGQDIDNRISSITWTIFDTGSYGTTNTIINSLDKTEQIFHTSGNGTAWYNQPATSGAFTNPGSHNVSISVVWNDGFSEQTTNFVSSFNQSKFTGPVVNFSQTPPVASVLENVTFSNQSTNTSRVGLGLPNHVEYNWSWEELSNNFVVLDQPLSYVFTKASLSAEAKVTLCAEWSDGWDTTTTCLEKSVVFGTTVTVDPEECYYKIKVVGTSSDGTISGYSWAVSSGISATGPWSRLWVSPEGIEQQEKTLCFSTASWYKIEGFVHGNGATTTDDHIMYVEDTCPSNSSVHMIWNGTGPLDIGTDWVRIGKGAELPQAVYQGTNGLLVANSADGDNIIFHRPNYFDIDINNYDFLSLWINIKKWEQKKDIIMKLYSTNYNDCRPLNLSSYIMMTSLNSWQRVMVPLKRFKIKQDKTKAGWPTYVNELRLEITGTIDFWLDEVALIMGELITVSICAPDMETTQVGDRPAPPSVKITPVSRPYPRPTINI